MNDERWAEESLGAPLVVVDKPDRPDKFVQFALIASDVFRRIGTTDAISWPVFWVTFVAASIGNFLTNPTSVPLTVRSFTLVVGQVAFWLPMLAVGELLRRRTVRHASYVVLGALAVGLLLRTLAVSSLVGFAVAPEESMWSLRLLSAMLNIAPVFIWTAFIVNMMRERRQQITTLERQRADLEHSVELVSAGVAQRNEETIDRVRNILTGELMSLDPSDARQSLASLQRTASDVVRPLSHELARSLPTVDEHAEAVQLEEVSWAHVLDVAASGRPFRPLITALLLCFPVLGGILLDSRALPAAVVTVFSLVLMLELANRVVARLFDQATVLARVSILVTAALGVSVAAGLVAGVMLAFTSYALAAGVGIAVASTVLSFGAAIVTALMRDRDQVIGELRDSSQSLRRNLVRWRQAQWFQQKALSRALHGPVQTAVNAAAIRLDAELQQGDVSAEVIVGVRTELLNAVDVLNAPHTTVAPLVLGIERIIGTWDGICSVTVDFEPAVELILDDDPALRSCVIDILTDAAGNAITHGKSTSIAARLAFDPQMNALRLVVRSDGTADASDGSHGLGTQVLDDCSLEWVRRSWMLGQFLYVLLPAP